MMNCQLISRLIHTCSYEFATLRHIFICQLDIYTLSWSWVCNLSRPSTCTQIQISTPDLYRSVNIDRFLYLLPNPCSPSLNIWYTIYLSYPSRMDSIGYGMVVPPENILEPDGNILLILGRSPADSRLLDPSQTLFQVSSEHMVRVSPVFRAMLSGHFREGTKLRSQDFLRLPLPEDDPEALSVLLRVTYGQIGLVPTTLDINTLVEMAMLVDKYQFNNVIGYFSARWFNCYKDSVLYSRHVDGLLSFDPLYEGPYVVSMADLYAWLFVSYYFGRKKEFARAAGLLVRQSQERIGEDSGSVELPIPTSMLGQL